MLFRSPKRLLGTSYCLILSFELVLLNPCAQTKARNDLKALRFHDKRKGTLELKT